MTKSCLTCKHFDVLRELEEADDEDQKGYCAWGPPQVVRYYNPEFGGVVTETLFPLVDFLTVCNRWEP